jgi:hypothetical protein
MPRQKTPPPKKAEGSGDPCEVIAALRELLEEARADNIELKTKIVNNDLIPCELYTVTFGRLMSVFTSQINILDLSIGDSVAGILGMPVQEVRGIIGNMQYEPIQSIQKGLIAFIEKN